MMEFIRRVFGLERCMVCHKKPVSPRYYFDDEGNRKPVCFKCVSYAERRAYRKA